MRQLWAVLGKEHIRDQVQRTWDGNECRRAERWLLLPLSHFSHVWLCATPQMTAHQAPPSLGFSRQEHWSGLPFPSPDYACMLSCLSRVPLCVIPWTAANQAPLSTGVSRQEHWSGLPFPSPRKMAAWLGYSEQGAKVEVRVAGRSQSM